MLKDTKHYKIIVVEDNAGDFFLLEDYLQETIAAPEILHFQSFKELNVFLETAPEGINIILLDLTLPDKRGEDLIKDTLAIAAAVPVVALTGYTDASFAVKSLSLGVSDYLLKDDLNAVTLYKSIIYNIERNKNLVKLKDSEHRYSDLFHLSPQPMWVHDKNSHEFLDVNEAAIQHYGFSNAEFLSMTLKDILPEEDILSSDVNPANGENDTHDVRRHKKKNGEIIYVDVRSNIIPYQGRKAEVVLVNDITESLKHIKAIELQNEKLTEIAWTQSHVVRAPLARIMGLIELITDESTEAEDRKEMLNHVVDSAYELDEIIRTIVNKSKQIMP